MNKKEFAERIRNEVEAQTHHRVEVKGVIKLNGQILTGLLIQEEGYRIIPTIFLEQYYEEYKAGEEIEIIVSEIIKFYNKNKIKENEELSFFADFSKVKGKIRYKLINFEANKVLLQQIPYTRMLDLAKVYYISIDMCGIQGYGNILIRNSHIELWNVTDEEVKHAAEENTPNQLPAQLIPIENLMMQLLKIEEGTKEHELFQKEFAEEKRISMYVITNTQKIFGAATMCYKNLLNSIADSLGTDLFILPSSLHELILVPAKSDIQPKELKEMVVTVNRTDVELEERLSDNVYIYHKTTDTIAMI